MKQSLNKTLVTYNPVPPAPDKKKPHRFCLRDFLWVQQTHLCLSPKTERQEKLCTKIMAYLNIYFLQMQYIFIIKQDI